MITKEIKMERMRVRLIKLFLRCL